MGQRQVGVHPLEAEVGEGKLGQRRRPRAQGLHGRAHIMAEAGQRELRSAGTPTDGVVGLVHAYPEPGTSQGHRRGEPVGPRSDDDGVELGHHASVPRRLRMGVASGGAEGAGPPARPQEVAMTRCPKWGVARRTPRPPSSIQTWLAPVRNQDWVAACIAVG